MILKTGIDEKGKIVDIDIFNEGLKYFAGKQVVLRCDEEKKKRTIDQNDALWRWDFYYFITHLDLFPSEYFSQHCIMNFIWCITSMVSQ